MKSEFNIATQIFQNNIQTFIDEVVNLNNLKK